MIPLRSIVAALLLAALNSPLFAQHYSGIPTFGREFYAPIITTSGYCPGQENFVRYRVLITAPTGASVSISTGNGYYGSLWITPMASAECVIPRMTPKSNVGETIEACFVHISSSAPISAYLYTEGPRTGALSRILPVQLLDNQYVVATLPSNDGTGATTLCSATPGSSMFAIVAVADSTWVFITPNGTTLTERRGVSSGTNSDGTPHPDTVLLNHGQVYFVKSETANEGADEAGSIVTSTKPIAVWGGHEAALNGLSSSQSHGLEQRNILMQQLVPKRYWRSKDYLSMQLMDSPGGEYGSELAGERLRVFTWDDANRLRIRTDSGSERTPTINRYQFADVDNILKTLNVSSASNRPVSPVLFDYRDQNTSEPFTAPTMMVLSPWENRSRVHAFSLLDPGSRSNHRFYINVIAQSAMISKIKYWKDGQGPKPLTALPTIGAAFGLPGLTGLTARRFEITPGSYYFTGDSGFLMYSYGDIGMSPSYNLTGYTTDNSYTSFATPLAETMGTSFARLPAIAISESCGTWTVTATGKDSTSAAAMELLSDPRALFRQRTTDSGYVSTNMTLSQQTALVTPGDTSSKLRLNVMDRTKTAEAYVWIVNRAGYDTVIHLSYRPEVFAFDSAFDFLRSPLHQPNCKRFALYNRGTLASDTIRVFSARTRDTNFRVTFDRTLPLTLRGGDSLTGQYCYLSERAGRMFFDTLSIDMGCATAYAVAAGSSTFPIIYATDCDFGRVTVGRTRVHTVNVKNVGTEPLIINGVRPTVANPAFTYADTTKFPITLAPGISVYLNFQFSPTRPSADTVVMEWITTAEGNEKSYSSLMGIGIEPALGWDAKAYHFGTWNTPEMKAHLFNPSSILTGQEVFVDSVTVIGADRNDFAIVGNQLGTNYIPLVNFRMNPQDTIWVQLRFSPDTSTNRETRHATLIAYDQADIRPVADLVGSIGVAGVKPAATASDVIIEQRKDEIVLSAPGDATLELFDVTGRRLQGPVTFRRAHTLQTSGLASGVYFFRVREAGGSVTRVVRIP